jgi:hypothetical protein
MYCKERFDNIEDIFVEADTSWQDKIPMPSDDEYNKFLDNLKPPERTVAQRLDIKDFPFHIKNSDGELIYFENSDNYWERYVRDDKNRVLYHEKSNGYKEHYNRDSEGNILFYLNSNGMIIDNEKTK